MRSRALYITYMPIGTLSGYLHWILSGLITCIHISTALNPKLLHYLTIKCRYYIYFPDEEHRFKILPCTREDSLAITAILRTRNQPQVTVGSPNAPGRLNIHRYQNLRTFINSSTKRQQCERVIPSSNFWARPLNTVLSRLRVDCLVIPVCFVATTFHPPTQRRGRRRGTPPRGHLAGSEGGCRNLVLVLVLPQS